MDTALDDDLPLAALLKRGLQQRHHGDELLIFDDGAMPDADAATENSDNEILSMHDNDDPNPGHLNFEVLDQKQLLAQIRQGSHSFRSARPLLLSAIPWSVGPAAVSVKGGSNVDWMAALEGMEAESDGEQGKAELADQFQESGFRDGATMRAHAPSPVPPGSPTSRLAQFDRETPLLDVRAQQKRRIVSFRKCTKLLNKRAKMAAASARLAIRLETAKTKVEAKLRLRAKTASASKASGGRSRCERCPGRRAGRPEGDC